MPRPADSVQACLEFEKKLDWLEFPQAPHNIMAPVARFGKFGLWTFQTHPTWSRCFYSRFLRPGGSDLCTASVYKSDASPTAKTEVTDLSVTDDVDCQGPQRSATEIRLVSEGLVVAERLFFFLQISPWLGVLKGFSMFA